MNAEHMPTGGLRIQGDLGCGEISIQFTGGKLLVSMSTSSLHTLTTAHLRAVSRLALVGEIAVRRIQRGQEIGELVDLVNKGEKS